jgi:predicted O-methyltransferase YrrM
MPLPPAVRRLAPAPLRDSPRLRGLALGAGLIPPRPMHTDREAALLRRLATARACVVEVGVYEGSSSVQLVDAMAPDATLHLVDPYVENALRSGWRGVERATRRTVERAARRSGGPRLRWHVCTSEEAARGWNGTPVDVVFIDGDHTREGARLDWELWSPHVSASGVVVFHDAREGKAAGRGLPGPTAVVDELFRAPSMARGWDVAEEVDSAVAVVRRG